METDNKDQDSHRDHDARICRGRIGILENLATQSVRQTYNEVRLVVNRYSLIENSHY